MQNHKIESKIEGTLKIANYEVSLLAHLGGAL